MIQKIVYEEQFGTAPDSLFVSKDFYNKIIREIVPVYPFDFNPRESAGILIGCEFYIIDGFKSDFRFFEKSDLYAMKSRKGDVYVSKSVADFNLAKTEFPERPTVRTELLDIPYIVLSKFRRCVESMNWSRFNIDDWLHQYGLYLNTCRMQGGNRPDDLRVSAINWAIEREKGSNSARSSKNTSLLINETEYCALHTLFNEFMLSDRVSDSIKPMIKAYLKYQIEGLSFERLSKELGISISSCRNTVLAGKFYMLGHDKRLKLELHS